MDYKEAMEYINCTAKFGSNLGLLRIKKLLEYMGNPEKDIKCIHVAGTNGKGSVSSMISRILADSGLKVGTYTSPHLERFTERITINDKEIPEDDVARIISSMEPIINRIIGEGYEHPTEFEIITAMMFKYFSENKIDCGVIEVGLGGRLDATNVITPLISVITTISIDHVDILGDTLGKIAYEKAGIIKEHGTVVVYPQEAEANEVIKRVCSESKATMIAVKSEGVILKSHSIDGQIFDLDINGESYENLSIKLLGRHQLLNAKTAITAVKALSIFKIHIDKSSVYKGLSNVRWPGRLEVMGGDPIILLDGAHNLQGIESLVDALKIYFKYNKLVLVMGVLRDKEVREMCEKIMPLADTIITTLPTSHRALPAQELDKIAASFCSDIFTFPHSEDAYRKGIEKTNKGDLLLFCGSLYMIGNIRTILQEKGH